MEQSERRLYLSFALKILLFIAAVLISIPIISSMQSPEQTGKTPHSPWHVEVSLANMQPGEIRQTNWPGGEVWIYRRTHFDKQHLARPNPELRDPGSASSQQPEGMKNKHRSLLAEYFVFIPNETKRGCLVHWDEALQLFSEKCHGARFDTAGRIYRDSGHAQQQNLRVPNYRLKSDKRILLLPPGH